MSEKSLLISKSAFKKPIGPIIRDTSATSVAIVVYGDPINCHALVRLHHLPTDTWYAQKKVLRYSLDYAERFVFEGLSPSTEYYYSAVTSDQMDLVDWDTSKIGTFRTDDPESTSYTFAFGSCRYFLQVGNLFALGDGFSDVAFQSISNLIQVGKDIGDDLGNIPSMLLQIGDQVYTDLIKELPFIRIKSRKNLRALHRSARSTKGFRKIGANIETKGIEDDHSYRDNGSPIMGQSEPEVYQNCLDMVNLYDHPEGPFPPQTPLSYGLSFRRGPANFYLLDTRFARTETRIMSEENWLQLEDWMKQDPNEVKFLVSPVPVFLQRYQDSWYGFQKDQFRLVDLIVRLGLTNLFILTGDAHASVSASFNILKNGESTGHRVVEIMSSGLTALVHDSKKKFFNSAVVRGEEIITLDDDNNFSDKSRQSISIEKNKERIKFHQRKIVKYTLQTDQLLSDWRKKIIRKNNFAIVKTDLGRNCINVMYRKRRGNIIYQEKFPIYSYD